MSIQGSTTSILDKTGKGELSYEYDEFGETTIHGGSGLANEICYTGGIYDESTGLYYLNARYYDPTTGRFLTEDTYRGESGDVADWHLYAYCENDPINYVDPSGHDAIVLKSNFASQYVGHMAILIQYGGNWRYFSWALEGYKSPYMNWRANIDNEHMSVKNKTVYDYLNTRFKRGKGSKKYKKYIYIEGDFKKCYKYIEKIKNGDTKYKNYSLTGYNCAWMAIQVLRQGNLTKTQQNKLYGMQYHKEYSPKHPKGKKVISTIIPSTALKKISNIFGKKIKNVVGT